MKTRSLILLLAWPPAVMAGPRTSANYSITTDALDSGGAIARSANYRNTGSAGLISGNANTAPATAVAKAGYLAQLYEITGLIVTSAGPSVDEGASVQLGARQLLDDATSFAVEAASVAWGPAASPLASISASGLATAELVYEKHLRLGAGNVWRILRLVESDGAQRRDR